MKFRNQFLKNLTWILLVCLGAIVFQHATSQQVQKQGMSKMTPEQRIDLRVNKMKQELNLTDDQAAKLKQLFSQEHLYRTGNEGGHQPNAEERKNMMNEMSKILTPEQIAKWKEMRKAQKDRNSSGDK